MSTYLGLTEIGMFIVAIVAALVRKKAAEIFPRVASFGGL